MGNSNGAGGSAPPRHRTRASGHLIGLAIAAAAMLCGRTRALADGGGAVLPSSATPGGYSLQDLTADTASYLVGAANGLPDTPPPPDIPFNIIAPFTSHTIQENTYSYVPISYTLDTSQTGPDFPSDPTDQTADAAYFDALLANGGFQATAINVDGQLTVLDDGYITGTLTPDLNDDGVLAMIQSAAVVGPLSPGSHDITIGYADGQGYPTYNTSFVITVVPEPGTFCVLLASGWLLRRRR